MPLCSKTKTGTHLFLYLHNDDLANLIQDVIRVDFEPFFDHFLCSENNVEGVKSARQPADEGEQNNQNLKKSITEVQNGGKDAGHIKMLLHIRQLT